MERFDQAENLPMNEDEIDLRSELATTLRGSVFPAQREDLLDLVQHEDAEWEVLELVRSLPSGQVYENVEQVWETAGGPGEGAHTNNAYSGGFTDAFRGTGVGTEDPNIVGDAGSTDVAPGTDND